MQFLLHLFALFGIRSIPVYTPWLGCIPVGILGLFAPLLRATLAANVRLSYKLANSASSRGDSSDIRLPIRCDFFICYILGLPYILVYYFRKFMVAEFTDRWRRQTAWSRIWGKSLFRLRLPVSVFRVYAIVYASRGLGHRFRAFPRSCRNPRKNIPLFGRSR